MLPKRRPKRARLRLAEDVLKEEILNFLEQNPAGLTLRQLAKTVRKSKRIEKSKLVNPETGFRPLRCLLHEMRDLVVEITHNTEEPLFRCILPGEVRMEQGSGTDNMYTEDDLKNLILNIIQQNPNGITLREIFQGVRTSEMSSFMHPESSFRPLRCLLHEMRDLVVEITDNTAEPLFTCRLPGEVRMEQGSSSNNKNCTDDDLKELILKMIQQNPDGVTLQEIARDVRKSEMSSFMHPESRFRPLKCLLHEMRDLVVEITGNSEEPLFRCRQAADEPPVEQSGGFLDETSGTFVTEKSGLSAIYKMILTLVRKHRGRINVMRLIENVRSTYGIDLEKYSRDAGFEKTIDLFNQVPRSKLLGSRNPEYCSINSMPVPGMIHIIAVVHTELINCDGQMDNVTLIDTMREKYQLDLEKLCQDLYYNTTNDILKQVPNIIIFKPDTPEKSVIRLLAGASLHSFYKENFRIPQLNHEGLSPIVCQMVMMYIKKHPGGTKVNKLITFMRKEYGLHLEKYSKYAGCENTINLLKLIPNTVLVNTEKACRCIIKPLPGAFEKFTPRSTGTATNTPKRQCSNDHTTFKSPNSEKDMNQSSSFNATPYKTNEMDQCMVQIRTKASNKELNGLCAILSAYLGAFWYRPMKLQTLKAKIRLEHGIDLEKLSRNMGCDNILSVLQLAPTIRAIHTDQHSKCLLYVRKGFNVSLECIGLCQAVAMPRCYTKQKYPALPRYPASMYHSKYKPVRAGFRNRISKFIASGFVKPSPVPPKMSRQSRFKQVPPTPSKKPLNIEVTTILRKPKAKKKKRCPNLANTASAQK